MEPKDLLDFDRMLFPISAKTLFLLSLAVCFLAGGYWIWLGLSNQFAGGYLVLYGILHLVIGPIVLRIGFETLINIYLIQNHLSALRAQRNESQGAPAYSVPPPPPAPPGHQFGYPS